MELKYYLVKYFQLSMTLEVMKVKREKMSLEIISRIKGRLFICKEEETSENEFS